MSTQRFTASDLGVVVGRSSTTPATVSGLVTGLRDNLSEWVALASATRADGGRITAVARTVARFASILADDHGADADAVADSIRTRSILDATDNAVIGAYFPTAFTYNADDDSLTPITADDDDADADADAVA